MYIIIKPAIESCLPICCEHEVLCINIKQRYIVKVNWSYLLN